MPTFFISPLLDSWYSATWPDKLKPKFQMSPLASILGCAENAKPLSLSPYWLLAPKLTRRLVASVVASNAVAEPDSHKAQISSSTGITLILAVLTVSA